MIKISISKYIYRDRGIVCRRQTQTDRRLFLYKRTVKFGKRFSKYTTFVSSLSLHVHFYVSVVPTVFDKNKIFNRTGNANDPERWSNYMMANQSYGLWVQKKKIIEIEYNNYYY